VPAGTREDTTICLTDLLATIAGMLDRKFDPGASPDTHSFLPLLKQNGPTSRPPVVHHSVAGMFAIRDGGLKLILGNGSGGREKPRGAPFGKPYQLYNINADPREKNDLAKERPEEVTRLTKAYLKIAGKDAPETARSK